MPDTQPSPDALSMSITERSDSGSLGTSSTTTTSTETNSLYSDVPPLAERSRTLDISLSSHSYDERQGNGRGDNIKPHQANCSFTSKPRAQVECASRAVSEASLGKQYGSVPIFASPIVAVSYEKTARPRVNPMPKDSKSSVCKKTPRHEIIDLTNSDEDIPASNNISTVRPSEKKRLSNHAPVNGKLRDGTLTPISTKVVASPMPHRNTEAEARSVAAVGPEKETQPFLLVHDEKAQAILDKHVIARGIQFEIVRGISQGLWGWDCISEANAMKLRGRNSEVAPLLSQIINSGKTEGGITPLVLASRAAILYVHPTALTLLSLTRSIALNSIENTTHD